MPTQSDIDEVGSLLGLSSSPAASQPAPVPSNPTPAPATTQQQPSVNPTPSASDIAEIESGLGINSSLDTSGMDAQFNRMQNTQRASKVLPMSADEVLRQQRLKGDETLVPRDSLLPDPFSHEGYLRKNQEPGIPLDQDTGVGALTRLKVGVHRNKLDQLDVLRKEYGDEAVRLDDKGDFIVRTTDGATGKLKDLKVDERNLTMRDFLDVASEYPAMALSMLTTKGVPVGNILQGVLKATAGYAAGGVGEDLMAESQSSRGVDLGEILSHRGTEAAFNTALGYPLGKGVEALGSLAQAVKMAGSSLADTTSGAMGQINAAGERVTANTGIEVPRSLAEKTGNPLAIRMQTFLSNIPFARGPILKYLSKQAAAEREIQNVFTGGQMPDESGVGSKLIDLLGGEMKGAETKAINAAGLVRQQGTEALQAPLDSIPGKQLSSAQFGQRMTKRADAQLQSFKNRAAEKFDAVRAQPDATQPVFDTTPIKDAARAVKSDELVKDYLGRPINELAPSGLVSTLDAIQKIPDNASYFDLVRLRSAIYDRIDSPEPISSQGSRLLKKVGAAISSELDTQGKSVLSPTTQAMLKDANEFYKKNVETFYQKGISDMLKPRTESGAIDPEQIANRLLAGGKGSVTVYNTAKSFFEKPQAVEDMNRLLRDKVLESGTDQATGLISLENLSYAVSKMEPEIVKALFGKSKDELIQIAQHSQLALRAGNVGSKVPFMNTQASVEADELQKLFNSGNVTPQSVRGLVTRQAELREQYGNAIRSSVRKNDFGVIAASPETFVKDYLLNPSISEAAVKDVMQSINATGDSSLIGDIRRVYFSDIFKNAAKTARGDATQAVNQINQSPLRDLDAQKFAISFENPAVTKRMQLILGHDSFEGLKDFAMSMAGKIPRDASGTVTGAFKGGSMFDKMLAGNLVTMSEVPKFVALSYLMTNPGLLSKLTSMAAMSDTALQSAVRHALLTPEFMDAISKQAQSPQQAREIAQEVKKWAYQTKPDK